MKHLVTMVLLAVLVMPAMLLSQTTVVSQISGVVRDTTGAVVPGAQVQLVNINTNAARTVQSGGDGAYTFTNVGVGTYALQASAEGFQTYRQSGIEVHVNSNYTVNVALPPGTVTQEVDVQADTIMVETQSTGVGSVINQQDIVELPLNGRQANQLIELSGAAVASSPGGIVNTLNYPTVSAVSVGGAQATSTMYFLDGAPNLDRRTNVGLPLPFPDALGEFKVETSALPANNGSLPGGAVNAVTKSGTNAFHGSAFEFLRNGKLNARNYFASSRDSLKRNQFGGTLGGPIVTNRLFFFTGFQGTTERTAPAERQAFVPTQEVLNGDFRTILGSGCKSKPVTLSSSIATNNVLKPGVVSPIAQNFLSLLPVSSDPCGEIRYGIPTATNEYQGVGRVDWQRTDTDTLFFRTFISDYSLPPYYDGTNLLTSGVIGLSDRITSIAIGDTHTLSPTIVNSARLSFLRSSVHRINASNTPTPAELGANVSSPIDNYLGQFSISGYFSLSAIPGYIIENVYSFSDDLGVIKGSHQMNMGFMWVQTRMNALGPFQMNPRLNFDGSYTGDALADFMTGNLNQIRQGGGQIGRDTQNSPSLYFQDFWKISQKFQLNLGIRWDPFLPQQSKYGYASNFSREAFDAGQVSKTYPNAPPGLSFPGDPGFPGKANNFPQYDKFSPRVGLVWDPKGEGKQVLRAGYGIFYGGTYTWQTMHVPLNPPWGQTIVLTHPTGGFANPWQGYPGGDPFANPVTGADATFPLNGVFVFEPRNVQPTYVQQWNLAFQSQIARNWTASATYMGNKTTHEWLGREINPAVYGPGATTGNVETRRVLYRANPATGQYFGSMGMVDDSGNGSYNGLLLSLQGRLSNNVSIRTNYTWSHCLDQGSVGQDIGNSYQNPNDRRANWGNCDSDRRQLFNFSFHGQTPTVGTGLLAKVLGGWKSSVIFRAQTGSWITVTRGRDVSLTGIGDDRPNLVGDPNLDNPSIGKWFNTDAFVSNAPGQFGNAGRNIIEGPGRWNVDLSVSRVFSIRENFDATLRWEAFNALNHTRFNNPVTNMNSTSTFGKITSADDPRIMQVALKLQF